MKTEKLHPVPSAIDRFNTAVQERDGIRNRSAALQARIAALAGLEATFNDAQASMTAVTTREAEALAAWAREGATGQPPQPDLKSREDAAKRLAQAQLSLRAAGAAKSQLEREMLELNQTIQPAQGAVEHARAHVLGDEFLRLHAEFLRAHDEQSRLEHRFAALHRAMYAASPQIAGHYSEEVHKRLVERANQTSTIPHEAAAAHQRWWADTFGDD